MSDVHGSGAARAGDVAALKAEVARLSAALAAANEQLHDLRTKQPLLDMLWRPPGHFSSPIASLDEVRAHEAELFAVPRRQLPAIRENEAAQVELCRRFATHYRTQPWREHKQPGLRYFFENPSYSYSDGLTLHCTIREARPRRIIEVGSGYSSCATLDTNERFFDGSIECTFIEPYPERLDDMLHPGERARLRILGQRLQEVPLDEFRRLQANDILFFDSTHVGKIGSDVNYALFEILPAIASGVLVHVHDVFWPFEYPREWVYEGRNWNEAYMLRAFLQYNDAFEIVYCNTFMAWFHRELLAESMPLCLRNTGGSIWLRKR